MQHTTNPNAEDGYKLAPADLPKHLKRRFHISLNNQQGRETVIVQ